MFADAVDHQGGALYGLAGLPAGFIASGLSTGGTITGRGTSPAGDENKNITEESLPQELDRVMAIGSIL